MLNCKKEKTKKKTKNIKIMKNKILLLTIISIFIHTQSIFSQKTNTFSDRLYLGYYFQSGTSHLMNDNWNSYSFFDNGIYTQYKFKHEKIKGLSIQLGYLYTIRYAIVNSTKIYTNFHKIPLLYKVTFPGLKIQDKEIANFNIGLGWFLSIPIEINQINPSSNLQNYNTDFYNHGLYAEMNINIHLAKKMRASVGFVVSADMFTISENLNHLNFYDMSFYIGLSYPISLFKTLGNNNIKKREKLK